MEDENYGTVDEGASTSKRKQRTASLSVTYCLHGRVAKDCCDSVKIKTIEEDCKW